MMAKEKALQLLDTFTFYLGDDGKGNEFYTDKLEALRGAAACVDEIVLSQTNMWENSIDYWKKVKQELNKLL